MTLIKHTKSASVPDWTQAQLDTIIGGGAAPLPPAGTMLAGVVLPSDWNHDHDVSGFLAANNIWTGAGSSYSGLTISTQSLGFTLVGGSTPATLAIVANGTTSTISLGVGEISIVGSGNYAINQSLQTVDSPTFGSITLSSQANALSMNSHKITNVTDPTSTQDAATKNYVDNAFSRIIAPTTFGYNATLAPDAVTNGLFIRCTLTGAAHLNPPTSPSDGMKWKGLFFASGGAQTLTFDAAILIPSASSSTGAQVIPNSKMYETLLEYDSVLGVWRLASLVGAYG